MRAYYFGLLAAVILLMSGCSTNPSTPLVQEKITPRQQPEAKQPALRPEGNGIAVCDPVDSASGATPDFAAGCGRWLEMTLAGNGALGQSPSWGETLVAAKQCHHRNLALLPKDMFVFLRSTGSDLGVLGSCTATGSHWTLTYRLYSSASHGLIGKPFSLSGTQADIVNGLPQLAKQILIAAGVSHAELPANVSIGAAELTQIGALSKYSVDNQAPTDLQASVLMLAKTVPLATLTCITCGVSPHDDIKAFALQNAAIVGAPQNVLILDAISYSSVLPTTLLPAIEAALVKYPNNYLARDSRFELMRQYAESQYRTPPDLNPAERTMYTNAAVALTQCAPRDPSGYAKVRSALSEIADEMRRRRTTDAISDSEMNTLSGLYKECIAADKQALSINPLRAHSWANLAVDATFVGDQTTASSAEETAIRLDNKYRSAYFWLLQMNMQKWFDSPGGLTRAIYRVRKAPLSDSDMAIAAGDLEDAGDAAGALHLFEVVRAHTESKLAKNPKDFDALYLEASMAHIQNNDEAAIPVLRRMVQIYPNVGALHVELGQYLYGPARYVDRQQQFSEARRLDLGTASVLNRVMGE